MPCERGRSQSGSPRASASTAAISRAGEHRLGHPAAEAGSRKRAELARMVRGGSPKRARAGAAGRRRRPLRDLGRAPRPAGPRRHRPHRRPALPSPPAGLASRASTRRGDAAIAPAPRRKPHRRAAPIPGSARRARRSARPPPARPRERAGAPAASAPAANSRPNWHSGRDSAVPNARGGRVLFHSRPPLRPTAGSAIGYGSRRPPSVNRKRRKAVKNRASQAERDEPPLRHHAEATPQDH